MNGIINIHSRRMLDEQDRFHVQAARDQDAPGRMPVEVLASQMRLYGMHAKFKDGSSRVAWRQLRERGVELVRHPLPRPKRAEPKTPHDDTAGKQVTRLREQGWVTAGDVAPLYGVTADMIRRFIRGRKFAGVKVGRRQLYRLEDLATYKRVQANGRRITMPDGREFGSLQAVADAHGIDVRTLRKRLNILGLAFDGAGILQAIRWQPKRGRGPTL